MYAKALAWTFVSMGQLKAIAIAPADDSCRRDEAS